MRGFFNYNAALAASAEFQYQPLHEGLRRAGQVVFGLQNFNTSPYMRGFLLQNDVLKHYMISIPAPT